MRVVTVSVTAEDIARGCQGDMYACPVARALTRAAGKHVEVEGSEYCARDSATWTSLPRYVSEWIMAFDDGAEVDPIAFQVDVPWLEPIKDEALALCT